jgi:hypothetical protein
LPEKVNANFHVCGNLAIIRANIRASSVGVFSMIVQVKSSGVRQRAARRVSLENFTLKDIHKVPQLLLTDIPCNGIMQVEDLSSPSPALVSRKRVMAFRGAGAGDGLLAFALHREAQQ